MGFIELRAAAQQLLDQMLSDGVLMDPEHPRRVAVEDLRAALAEPAQEPQCNPHPKAPHGFLRNASHTEHRYVCECEGWEPYEAGYQAGMESALAEPVHEPPTDWEAVAADQAMTIALMKAEPAQEPVAWMYDFLNPDNREEAIRNWVTQNPVEIEREKGFNVRPLYTAPPQLKPLTVMELQDALVYTDLIDPDAVNDPEGYDEGSTLAQIDELHRKLTA